MTTEQDVKQTPAQQILEGAREAAEDAKHYAKTGEHLPSVRVHTVATEQDVERVARAIYESREHGDVWGNFPDKRLWITYAKAALSAMPNKHENNDDAQIASMTSHAAPVDVQDGGGKSLDGYKFDESGYIELRPIANAKNEPVCPHIHTSTEGTSYCTLAESAGQRLAKHEKAVKGLAASINNCAYHVDIFRQVNTNEFSAKEKMLMLENILTAVDDAEKQALATVDEIVSSHE